MDYMKISMEEAHKWLKNNLNEKRYLHSLGTAESAKELAKKFGLNEERAYTAGLLHDCAKCLPLREMQRIAREHRLTDDPMILSSGGLLHALVGVPVAQEKYGMEDPEVLEAIAFHTTGSPGMSRLAMCVCLADFMEPLRESFPLLEEVRVLSRSSLEKALLLSLEGTVDYVKSRGWYLYPRTCDTITWLRQVVR
jgi:predicted HD superfamily hydrolase involved in NAD metabolism